MRTRFSISARIFLISAGYTFLSFFLLFFSFFSFGARDFGKREAPRERGANGNRARPTKEGNLQSENGVIPWIAHLHAV